jgi:hypothetical protein
MGSLREANWAMSVAVVALRVRLQWTQARLAHRIDKAGRRKSGDLKMRKTTVSRWERRLTFPSVSYRCVVAKLAAEHGRENPSSFRVALDQCASWNFSAANSYVSDRALGHNRF